jgi:hypothetical protein
MPTCVIKCIVVKGEIRSTLVRYSKLRVMSTIYIQSINLNNSLIEEDNFTELTGFT